MLVAAERHLEVVLARYTANYTNIGPIARSASGHPSSTNPYIRAG
jgi:hypothetical protein